MRRREWFSATCGLAALAVAVFALGGAPRWAQAAVAVLVMIALVPQLVSRRVFERVPPLVAVLALCGVLTAVQLLPLGSLVDRLDPVGSALRADGAALIGTQPWHAFTHDVPGSLRAVVFFLVLLGVAIVSLRVATTERGRYYVQAGVAVVCGLAAVLVGIHALFGLTRLYGVYEPHASPQVLGPLLNGNHLGCLMAVGTVVAAGLVMYRRQRAWIRTAWLVIVTACGAATLATLSRGAALALGAGLVVVAATLVAQRLGATESGPRRRRSSPLTSSVPIGIVAACTIIVVLYASAGGVSEQLSHTRFDELHEPRSKFAAWRSATQLIRESPWVGVGRGGFESSFTRVHPASAFGTFSHVENEYVQSAVDWGLPGAILLAIGGIWLAILAIRRWRDGPLAAGGLGALAVVALQSNVDFGVELLGVAVPITAVAATLTYVQLREPIERRRLTVARAFRLGHLALLVIGGVVLLSSATTTLAEDHERIASRGVTLDDLRTELDRHPFDYYGYARAAELMVHDGDKRAIHLLNHALVLHPTNPGLHEAAADLLFATGHLEQSTIEYALAIRGTLDKRRLIGQVASRFSPPLAAAAIPTDSPSLDVIVAILDDLHRSDLATAWLAHVIDVRPGNLRACELMYTLAIRGSDVGLAASLHDRCSVYEPGQSIRLELRADAVCQARLRCNPGGPRGLRALDRSDRRGYDCVAPRV